MNKDVGEEGGHKDTSTETDSRTGWTKESGKRWKKNKLKK